MPTAPRQGLAGLRLVVLAAREPHPTLDQRMLALADAAAALGVPVRLATQPGELASLEPTADAMQVIVLTATALACAALRGVLGHLRKGGLLHVLALGSDVGARQPHPSLHVDTVLPVSASMSDMLAALHAIVHPPSAGKASGGHVQGRRDSAVRSFGVRADPVRTDQPWMLCREGWILRSPQARDVLLTPQQRWILGHLFAVGPQGMWQPDCPNLQVSRQIAMAVSRLRHRARAVDLRLPIRAVRGKGYQFTEPCVVRDEPAALD